MEIKSDEYLSIRAQSSGTYKEKGSKFIALAFPVCTEQDVKSILHKLRKEYHDARHHCYAYRFGHTGETYRANDDGEPSGTAGKPIHGQLVSFNLTDVLIVVVRYFGGTKLGASGLINAYRTAAREAIEEATIVVHTLVHEFSIRFTYNELNQVMRILKDEGAKMGEQYFAEDCKLSFSIRQSKSESLSDRLRKMHKLEILSCE